jgi:hypothetical protein
MRTTRAWSLGLLAAVLASACSFSTADLDDFKMARDEEGSQPTSVFAPTETFHCVGALKNAPEGTTVKAVFTCIEAAGVENHEIDSTEIRSDSGTQTVHFELTNPGPWPIGKYKVDLYLDGELDETLEFEVAMP